MRTSAELSGPSGCPRYREDPYFKVQRSELHVLERSRTVCVLISFAPAPQAFCTLSSALALLEPERWATARAWESGTLTK
jgi:hypothetical protein